MDSYVEVKSGVYTSFVGTEAVEFLRVKALRSSLIGYHKFKMIPTRGVTVTVMLKLASQITGKTYKRAQILDAIFELEQWLAREHLFNLRRAQNILEVVNKD